MVRLVAPVQRDEVARQLANEVRIFQNDGAPENHPVASLLNFPVNPVQEVEINPALAEECAKCFAPATPQIPCLVATNIEEPAGKSRQQLTVEFADEPQRSGMIWRKRGG